MPVHSNELIPPSATNIKVHHGDKGWIPHNQMNSNGIAVTEVGQMLYSCMVMKENREFKASESHLGKTLKKDDDGNLLLESETGSCEVLTQG